MIGKADPLSIYQSIEAGEMSSESQALTVSSYQWDTAILIREIE